MVAETKAQRGYMIYSSLYTWEVVWINSIARTQNQEEVFKNLKGWKTEQY